jgi:hypothetical protein
VAGGSVPQTARSDAAGFFQIILPRGFRREQVVDLRFRHPDYLPLQLTENVGNPPAVVHLIPVVHSAAVSRAATTVANVRVRYSARTTEYENVGSTVKLFEVVNSGSIPCNGQMPCSPDGKWKAATSSVTIDAGTGNQFRNPRVSCIAGPCPFTEVESEGLSQDHRVFSVSARNWSETATFLIEAEVFRVLPEDIVRRLYPVIFGNVLNFTLPGEAEGPSIEADLEGNAIIFPLGPDVCLSWADCTVRTGSAQAKAYRCELKPGYRFP